MVQEQNLIKDEAPIVDSIYKINQRNFFLKYFLNNSQSAPGSLTPSPTLT